MKNAVALIKNLSAGNRTADYLLARAMGLPLVNPFTADPTLVTEVDNEWVVAIGKVWQPLPHFTTSTDSAIYAARSIHPGVMVDIEELGADQFRATLHWPNTNRRACGRVRTTRPLAVVSAAIENHEGYDDRG